MQYAFKIYSNAFYKLYPIQRQQTPLMLLTLKRLKQLHLLHAKKDLTASLQLAQTHAPLETVLQKTQSLRALLHAWVKQHKLDLSEPKTPIICVSCHPNYPSQTALIQALKQVDETFLIIEMAILKLPNSYQTGLYRQQRKLKNLTLKTLFTLAYLSAYKPLHKGHFLHQRSLERKALLAARNICIEDYVSVIKANPYDLFEPLLQVQLLNTLSAQSTATA